MTTIRQQYTKIRAMLVGFALIAFAACDMAKGEEPVLNADAITLTSPLKVAAP